ncbi:hypothetical protein DFQ27_002199 [Actinomortierella ambigua]|uniref:Uncharacterized protein n=1 Tax=Actinomortierella ambigua TaxID=1343610 RepID=A0A9P6QII5_9FUNG|nr:hypothetical protein DFQ27_002199 [Actinomortierella ambigua]
MSVTWKLKGGPYKGNEVADIYLVGGDYKAYQRIERLGKAVPLSNKKLAIPSVSKVQCGGTCTIQFSIPHGTDFYSHNFTIAPQAELQPNPSTSVVGGAGGSGGSTNGGGATTMGGSGAGTAGANSQSQQARVQSVTTGGAAGMPVSSTSLASIAMTSVLAAASIALNFL